jgi:hypothetical protein
VILPTMHTELQWRKHNYRDTGGLYKDMMLPQGYPFGTRPEGELQAPFGHRVSDRAPRLYHNVPVPRQGPHQMLDLKSWKRGVDDAIAALEATVGRSAARGGYDAGYKAAKEEGS